MKSQATQDRFHDALWTWAKTNTHKVTLGSWVLDTCIRSGSIFWQDDNNPDTQVYINYNWDNCGDIITGSISTGDGDCIILDDVDCSTCHSFEDILNKFLEVSTQAVLS